MPGSAGLAWEDRDYRNCRCRRAARATVWRDERGFCVAGERAEPYAAARCASATAQTRARTRPAWVRDRSEARAPTALSRRRPLAEDSSRTHSGTERRRSGRKTGWTQGPRTARGRRAPDPRSPSRASGSRYRPSGPSSARQRLLIARPTIGSRSDATPRTTKRPPVRRASRAVLQVCYELEAAN